MAVSKSGVASLSPHLTEKASDGFTKEICTDGNESDTSDASNRSYVARLQNPDRAYFKVDMGNLESRVEGLLRASSTDSSISPPSSPKSNGTCAEDVLAGDVRDVLEDHHGRTATSTEVGSALARLLPAIAAAKGTEGVSSLVLFLEVGLPLCVENRCGN